MSDIVRRLREMADLQGDAALSFQTPPACGYLLEEAADEIKRLRAALRFADAKLNGWLDADREEEAREAVRRALSSSEQEGAG